MRRPYWLFAVVLSWHAWLVAGSQWVLADEKLRGEAETALAKVVAFYDGQLSIHGGYLWRYAADLSEREGENQATETTAWVQPPGTPAVGMAWLQAYRRCQRPELLAAAKRTAGALIQGQLQSGGWTYSIHFDPKQRQRYAYRADNAPAKPTGRDRGANDRNVTTLDDDTTQSAVRFLMEMDLELKFQDQAIHEAVEFALKQLIAAQYPNGAWPQRFDQPPDAEKFPVLQARYPETWPREFPRESYYNYYTFNDNAQARTIELFFLAHEIYGREEYLQAARRGADFILLAQMPEPQPAWAQQYNARMEPAWARKFEPPAITGSESQSILRTLILAYRYTGDRKYLEPIPQAVAYLKKSLLPDGRLARFYELTTNRPLYFVRDTYELTYDDSNLPTHYSFKVESRLDAIEEAYQEALRTPADKLKPRTARPRPGQARPSRDLEQQVRRVIDALDERGAWVECNKQSTLKAEQVIDMRTLIRNVDTLARYLGTRDS